MRIAIIGNSGSGKSTLAMRLAAEHGLATLDLDTVAWEAGKIAVPRPAADAAADVQAFCAANEHWVVEGCYASLVGAALVGAALVGAAPTGAATLLFLDPGLDACLANCRARPWEPHKYASREEQDEKLGFLLSWVRAYYARDDDYSLAAHQALFDGYDGPRQKLVSLRDAEAWPGPHH